MSLQRAFEYPNSYEGECFTVSPPSSELDPETPLETPEEDLEGQPAPKSFKATEFTYHSQNPENGAPRSEAKRNNGEQDGAATHECDEPMLYGEEEPLFIKDNKYDEKNAEAQSVHSRPEPETIVVDDTIPLDGRQGTSNESEEQFNEAEDATEYEANEQDEAPGEYGKDQLEAEEAEEEGGSDDESKDEDSDYNESDTESEPDDSIQVNVNSDTKEKKNTRGKNYETGADKPRRAKPAKTAREWFRRENEKDPFYKRLKRKQRLTNDSSSKKRKIDNQQWPDFKDNQSTQARIAKIGNVEDISAAAKDGSLPSLGMMTATTHAGQLSMIKARMPQDGDTRRTKTQQADLKKSIQSFGYKMMKAVAGEGPRQKHKHMETSLMSYQTTVASWMIGRENFPTPPYGGVIGDEMGLGKTLVSLACIVGHPPEPKDIEEYSRATLIIVPSKMIARQWCEEVEKHCGVKYQNVWVYNQGEGKSTKSMGSKTFVIATYKEVMSQIPPPNTLQAMKEKYDTDTGSYHRWLAKEQGDLFNVRWYRVILDEAHQIKNVAGRTSIACSELDAKFRWCLSGTPLSNTPQEFYPYLRFIGCPFTHNSADFGETYVKCPKAKQNFDALVGLVLYRRTKKDSFLGHKIVDLPPAEATDIWVPLAAEEAIIYEAVFKHYEGRIQKLRHKKATRGLSEPEEEELKELTLAQSVRLRQSISHLFALEPFLRTKMKAENLQILQDELKSTGQKTVRDSLKSAPGGAMEKYMVGLSKLEEYKASVFGGSFNVTNHLILAENETRIRDDRCPACGENPTTNRPHRAAKCGHVYCLNCLLPLVKKTMESNDKSKCTHEDCGIILDVVNGNMGKEILTFTALLKDAGLCKKYKEPGNDGNNIKLTRKPEENGFFTAACYKGNKFSMPPSSKLTAALAVILTWQESHPNDKIIVFTQFVTTGKVLGYMLDRVGIPFLFLYGSVSDGARMKAIKAFKENDSMKIMVMGLKCGSQALNLTIANRVILIDPWWNAVQESQAFGRVWRIGQTKTSHMVRILGDCDEEHKISDLQTKKSGEIDYSLQDDGHKPVVLPDCELEELFNPRTEDNAKGRKQRGMPKSRATIAGRVSKKSRGSQKEANSKVRGRPTVIIKEEDQEMELMDGLEEVEVSTGEVAEDAYEFGPEDAELANLDGY